MPSKGSKTKTSGSLTIDCSNCAEGYVMVKAKPTEKKLKVRVTHGSFSSLMERNMK